jgi:hypothetical protein
VQCLCKLQPRQGVRPLACIYISMEKHPVREKHKIVISKGSNRYNLVHSEVKTHLGNTNSKRREKKFAVQLGVNLATWLVVCPHELLGRYCTLLADLCLNYLPVLACPQLLQDTAQLYKK